MEEVYQHLDACKRILDKWEEEEKRQFDEKEQEAVEIRMVQLFGEDWQGVLETLEVNSILFVR